MLMRILVVEDERDLNRVISKRLESADNSIRFSVKDEGIGIAEDDLKKIWDRFYQAGRSSNDSAGLGLSIVKSLTEVHGGKCDVKSKPGSGSVFSVWFPKN